MARRLGGALGLAVDFRRRFSDLPFPLRRFALLAYRRQLTLAVAALRFQPGQLARQGVGVRVQLRRTLLTLCIDGLPPSLIEPHAGFAAAAAHLARGVVDARDAQQPLDGASPLLAAHVGEAVEFALSRENRGEERLVVHPQNPGHLGGDLARPLRQYLAAATQRCVGARPLLHPFEREGFAGVVELEPHAARLASAGGDDLGGGGAHRVRAVERPRHRFEQRRLARAVGSHQPHQPVRELDVEAVEHAVVAHAQAPQPHSSTSRASLRSRARPSAPTPSSACAAR